MRPQDLDNHGALALKAHATILSRALGNGRIGWREGPTIVLSELP